MKASDTQAQKRSHPTQKPKDMTAGEFITWLRIRSQRRRRYAAHAGATRLHTHRLSVLVFLLTTAVALTLSMSYARLHRTDILSPLCTLSSPAALTLNPAITEADVTCAVSLSVGGETPTTLQFPPMTVEAFLRQAGCTLGGDDYTSLPPDTLITDGMALSVIRVTYEESREVVSLPYDTIYVDSQTIPRGSTERISYGTAGVAEQEQRRRYENGILTHTEVLSENIIEAPVDEQLYLGIGGYVSGVDGTFSYSHYLDVTATFYGGYDEVRYTYSGTIAREGVIAVDPDVIPLRTKVYVKGSYGDYGVCYADDIGGGIKGNHIDIFQDADYETLMEYGFRHMRVYFLD